MGTGAEHLPQVGINIPGFPIVISLENLREEHNHAEIVSFFSDDLVMLQNPESSSSSQICRASAGWRLDNSKLGNWFLVANVKSTSMIILDLILDLTNPLSSTT